MNGVYPAIAILSAVFFLHSSLSTDDLLRWSSCWYESRLKSGLTAVQ